MSLIHNLQKFLQNLLCITIYPFNSVNFVIEIAHISIIYIDNIVNKEQLK